MASSDKFVDSNFIRLVTNKSAMRIFELFVNQSPNTLNKREVEIALSMGRNTLYKAWELLDLHHILKTVDSVGRGRIYALNKDTTLTVRLIRVIAVTETIEASRGEEGPKTPRCPTPISKQV